MSFSKQKILFIINPISGGHNKAEIIKDIPKLLDSNKFEISFACTDYAGHAAEIAKKAVDNNFDIVAAVGGDGTINEVASQVAGTTTALAIVPCGSGNGMARDLKISLHYKKAIQQINMLKIKKIDVGICNNLFFFSLAGVGFDAQVAYDFNLRKKRKFLGYVWAVLIDYFKTKNQYYKIELENETITGHFFFITIANCSQWGYNVKVAPKAKFDDDMLHVVLCKKPPFFSTIPFGIKVLFNKIDTSKYCYFKTSKKILLHSDKVFFYHIDGHAKGVSQKIEIEVLHKKLNVVANT
jgi:YegS/Rv2252/BmrU family lipid kinase